jgi:ribosomal protein S18 acetylase RimI-like enzyme
LKWRENDNVFQDVDLFEKYEVDRMFVFHMIAVDSEFGGSGIGTQLVLRGIEHATRHGFKVLTAETTGQASAKIFQVTEKSIPSCCAVGGNQPI